MAQDLVYKYLRSQRLAGNHEYLSIAQVYGALLDMKTADLPARRAIWKNIRQLKKYGYIEQQGVGGWPSYFRLKEKYI